MKLKRLIVPALMAMLIGIGGGMFLGGLEVATLEAEIACIEGDIQSRDAEILILAIDNVMSYKADPCNNILTYTDVEIVNRWLHNGIIQ